MPLLFQLATLRHCEILFTCQVNAKYRSHLCMACFFQFEVSLYQCINARWRNDWSRRKMLSMCYHGRNDIKTNANDGRSVTFFPGHISRNPKPNMHSAFTGHPGLRTTYDKPSVAKFHLRYLCSIFLGRARPYRTSHYHSRLLPSKGRHCQFSVKKQHLGHIVYFAKNLSPVPWDKCVRWFKIYQIFSNFRGAVVLPRSRKNFCQEWNLTDLLIYTPWFEGRCQSRKYDLYFQTEYFSS